MKFKNKVLIIGYGSVAKCTIPILLRHIDIPYKNITIIDFVDKRKELQPWLKKGIKYFQERVTPININQLLSKYVSAGGLVIDLAWNIECIDMLNWCHDNKVLYINTSVEEWTRTPAYNKSAFKKSLYYKQMQIREIVSKWNNGSMTAVLDHGALIRPDIAFYKKRHNGYRFEICGVLRAFRRTRQRICGVSWTQKISPVWRWH